MILKFFKRPLPSVLAAIIVLAVLGWLKSFLSGEVHPFYFDNNQMPLYSLAVSIIRGNHLAGKIFSLSLLIICAIMLIQLNTKHILIKYRSYLPALIFILLSSSFLPLQRLNPALFASFFIILAIDNIFSSYDSANPLHHYFMASFFVALSSLFYAASASLFILIIISIIILRPTGFRGWLVSIIGFITPWILLFFYYYSFNDEIRAIPRILSSLSEINIKTWQSQGVFFTTFYSYASLLIIIALTFLIKSLYSQKISTRKHYSIIVWCLIILSAAAFLSPINSVEIAFLLAIPSSFILSNYFTFTRRRIIPEVLFGIFIVLALMMQFF